MPELNTHKRERERVGKNELGKLPILQKASDGYKLWHSYLPTLPRLSRYTLGVKIDALFTQLVELLLHAGYAEKTQKQQIVAKASTVLDALKFFLQIAWETKTLDNKKYVALSIVLVEVGKMLGGWRKQLEQQTRPGGPERA